jgi:microcystin-dependent protein
MGITPFMAEIEMFSFNFAPKGWAMANGQFLPINQNQALFSILGTTYGGDGQVNFALPDLRGRVPMYTGNGHSLGEKAGQEFHTLTLAEMPAHNHFVSGNNTNGIAGLPGITPDATKSVAQGLVSIQGGGTAAAQIYGTGAPDRTMPAGTSNYGGSQPHENRQPYLVINFCIALQGIFPSRN